MSMYSFTKLFQTITTSTIWCEPNATRLVWITMLAIADRKGRVGASIPGLASVARVSEAECETAINRFLSPDRHSRSQEHEGRRIAPIEGGWILLNHDKYRAMMDEETVREAKRNYMRNSRANAKKTLQVTANQVTVINKGNGKENVE